MNVSDDLAQFVVSLSLSTRNLCVILIVIVEEVGVGSGLIGVFCERSEIRKF